MFWPVSNEGLVACSNGTFLDSLIESLSQPSKQGLKTSDGSLSPWLVALATFTGAVYRRYTVEYEGILQYVTNQLKDGKSVDLMVLREVMTSTAGFEPINSLTADQLNALCSGETLRQEVGLAVAFLHSTPSFRSLVTRVRRANDKLLSVFEMHYFIAISARVWLSYWRNKRIVSSTTRPRTLQ